MRVRLRSRFAEATWWVADGDSPHVSIYTPRDFIGGAQHSCGHAWVRHGQTVDLHLVCPESWVTVDEHDRVEVWTETEFRKHLDHDLDRRLYLAWALVALVWGMALIVVIQMLMHQWAPALVTSFAGMLSWAMYLVASSPEFGVEEVHDGDPPESP